MKKGLNIFLNVAMVLCALAGIALIIFGALYSGDHTFTRVMAFVVGVLCLILSGELVYFLFFAGSDTPNFFLYDYRTRKNLPVQSLSAGLINSKMEEYFSMFAASEGKIWTSGILDASDVDIEDEFCPVVSYKLLLSLAVKDAPAGWKCFELASVETVDFICRGLEQNGDLVFAENIRKMKAVQPFDTKYIREYLVNNRPYLKHKMVEYVSANIEKFQ